MPVSKGDLKKALEQACPGAVFPEEQVESFLPSFSGSALPSDADLAKDLGTYIIAAGAANDDAEVRERCQGILRLLQPAATPADADAVPGLAACLQQLRLAQYYDGAVAWCNENGASSLEEVFENGDAFSDALKLRPLEKKRVLKKQTEIEEQKKGPSTDDKKKKNVGKGESFGPSDEVQYLLGEKLGEGATAIVYRCNREGKSYAAKVINLRKLKALGGSWESTQAKLHRETHILFNLRHKNIVSLIDVHETENNLYLVMELVDGGELFEYIVSRKRLKEQDARFVFMQLVSALEYIHTQGVVHRDLKPENILVDKRASSSYPIVKISDFGHSRFYNNSTPITRCGTPQYWAPEINDSRLCKEGYDAAVDLWSLGVVLFVMLEGRYPFEGGSTQMADQINRAKVSWPVGSRTSAPGRDIVGKLLQASPKDRLSLADCKKHAWYGGTIAQDAPETDDGTEFIPCGPPQDPSKFNLDIQAFVRHQRVPTNWIKADQIVQFGTSPQVSAVAREAAKNELRQLIAFHCPAIATTRSPISPAQLSTVAEDTRTIRSVLRVDLVNGAGMDLETTAEGMAIDKILKSPGQPDLRDGDIIIEINGVSLTGGEEAVEEAFGENFGDGSEITVRRKC